MPRSKTKIRSESPNDCESRIISASLKLALEREWQQISLEDIANAAEIPLNEVSQKFRSKISVLKAFNKNINSETMTNLPSSPSNTAIRDQIFEILMLKFDALSPHKQAISRIIQGTIGKDPIASVIGLEVTRIFMKDTLEAVGISTRGMIGHLKINGLLIVYLKTICTWLRDDSPDLAKTMADLDKSLTCAEKVLRTLSI